MSLSIVIPTWNEKVVLEKCLRSVYESKPELPFEILVVDNGSTDGTCAFLAEAFPRVLVLRNRENLGFSRACNQGIEQGEGRYLLLLNNDAMVQEDTLECLIRFMDDHPEAGAAAPRLLNPDGGIEVSACMEFISLKSAFFGGYELPFPLNRFIRPMALPLRDHDRTREVAWVPGTCLIFRKEILNTVGRLEEDIFMYMEDMEWCYRMRMAGWKVYFVADTGVVHLKHHSSRHRLGDVFRQNYLSKKLFMRKYRSKMEEALFTCLTFTGSMMKIPVLLTGLFFKGERERDRIRYKVRNHLHLVRFIFLAERR